MEKYDIVILGAGPAGLAAAIYAARYNLKTLVFDMGYGRSTWFQKYSNYVGFPDGISALELREQGQQQAKKLRVKFKNNEAVTAISGREGSFTVQSKKSKVAARYVILATGIEDRFPQFDGDKWLSYIGRSMFWCILCDGHYVNGQSVLCIGKDADGVEMTLRLRQFTRRLYFLAEDLKKIPAADLRKLKREKIPVFEGKIEHAEAKTKGMFKAVRLKLSDGSSKRLKTEAVFHRLGIDPYDDVTKQLGLKLDRRGIPKVNRDTQETSRPGIYAAGDGAAGHLHQVHAATYTGSRAAVSAYRKIYDKKFGVRKG